MAGTANRPLAEQIAQQLKQPLCQVTLRRFSDGEIFVKIDENVRISESALGVPILLFTD